MNPLPPLYSLNNYSFGTKEQQREKDTSVAARLERMERNYVHQGMRRSVEGVLLVHNNNHPHILLLQIGTTFFKLPGGKLRVNEDPVEGLKRKLTTRLCPNVPNTTTAANTINWQIHELISIWWRPHFENLLYPYTPPHVVYPKEQKFIYLVHLPEHAAFAVPSNFKLLAIPLFELYDNPARYGPIIASIPHMLARLRLETVPEEIPVQESDPAAISNDGGIGEGGENYQQTNEYQDPNDPNANEEYPDDYANSHPPQSS